MVVAQFTAVSLQKDDRAFVKYDPTSRIYGGIAGSIKVAKGDELSSGSSSTNNNTVFHLDSDAVYREGWQTKHIKMSNDAVIQIVSVFAIGFHKHFECLSGGDASITNSNSTLVSSHWQQMDLREIHLVRMIKVMLLISSHQKHLLMMTLMLNGCSLMQLKLKLLA